MTQEFKEQLQKNFNITKRALGVIIKTHDIDTQEYVDAYKALCGIHELELQLKDKKKDKFKQLEISL